MGAEGQRVWLWGGEGWGGEGWSAVRGEGQRVWLWGGEGWGGEGWSAVRGRGRGCGYGEERGGEGRDGVL